MEVKSVRIKQYCPNCGCLLYSIRNEKGVGKTTCQKCGVDITNTIKSRRHFRLEIYAPKDKPTTDG